MKRTATLDHLDGWLCAREDEFDWRAPIRRTYYWPLVQTPRGYIDATNPGLIGREVTYYPYGYTLFSEFPGGTHRSFPLPNAGQTKALKITEEPVPAPKVRAGIETRWRKGGWEKYLKRDGWVAA